MLIPRTSTVSPARTNGTEYCRLSDATMHHAVDADPARHHDIERRGQNLGNDIRARSYRWRHRSSGPRPARPLGQSPPGGRPARSSAAVVVYTLIESCRLTNVDIIAYLADVLVRVATHLANRVEELLPANWATLHAASVPR